MMSSLTFSGFFVNASGKPGAWDGYVDPYVTIQQKPRQMTEGDVQTSSFAVSNNRDNYPMVYVTQTEAKEFCQWLALNTDFLLGKSGNGQKVEPQVTNSLPPQAIYFNPTIEAKLANVANFNMKVVNLQAQHL